MKLRPRAGFFAGAKMFVGDSGIEAIEDGDADSYRCIQVDRRGQAFCSKSVGPWWRLLREVVLMPKEEMGHEAAPI